MPAISRAICITLPLVGWIVLWISTWISAQITQQMYTELGVEPLPTTSILFFMYNSAGTALAGGIVGAVFFLAPAMLPKKYTGVVFAALMLLIVILAAVTILSLSLPFSHLSNPGGHE